MRYNYFTIKRSQNNKNKATQKNKKNITHRESFAAVDLAFGLLPVMSG